MSGGCSQRGSYPESTEGLFVRSGLGADEGSALFTIVRRQTARWAGGGSGRDSAEAGDGGGETLGGGGGIGTVSENTSSIKSSAAAVSSPTVSRRMALSRSLPIFFLSFAKLGCVLGT